MESVGSLPVANVQALAAASGQNEVPPRYLRPEAQADPVAHDGNSLEIPVIDMSRLLQTRSSRDESTKLNLACEHWGFFQVSNPLVTKQIIERNLNRICSFRFGHFLFSLPPGTMVTKMVKRKQRYRCNKLRYSNLNETNSQ